MRLRKEPWVYQLVGKDTSQSQSQDWWKDSGLRDMCVLMDMLGGGGWLGSPFLLNLPSPTPQQSFWQTLSYGMGSAFLTWVIFCGIGERGCF